MTELPEACVERAFNAAQRYYNEREAHLGPEDRASFRPALTAAFDLDGSLSGQDAVTRMHEAYYRALRETGSPQRAMQAALSALLGSGSTEEQKGKGT